MGSVLEVIKNIGIVLLFLTFLVFFISLITSVINCVDAKTEKLKEEKKILEKRSKVSIYTLDQRVTASISILNLASDLVDKEIINTMKVVRTLGKRYEPVQLDKDVNNIAKKVFEAISFNDISSEELSITVEYIMQHITDETMIKLLNTINAYNTSLENA